MYRAAILILAVSLTVFGQSRQFTVDAPINHVTDKGVEVHFEYRLPPDDPYLKASKTFEKMTPATVIWYWGDDDPHQAGSKPKNHEIVPYKEVNSITHTYKNKGTFGVHLVVLDAKNRSVAQDGFSFKINDLVEIPTLTQ